ncbi:MAG: GNAT family N-acetyltransferase [Streptosporangiaceae bacterium]
MPSRSMRPGCSTQRSRSSASGRTAACWGSGPLGNSTRSTRRSGRCTPTEAARGRGIGRAILTHLLDTARTRGFRQVSLETGTTAAFAPARAPYASAGFVPCGPFSDYQPSRDNCFMTLTLA